ncbi:dachshund homolog 1-like [Galendromus occidentalis]|uniref:Dachshund homolog 1-like n=1 Tax=Galendromus occidentalis TaxID=34638 RepID=A0AAJ6VXK7_9ACAR|nr:dachshund homolog 1-like [Galendromus occidentalis]
MDDSASNSPPPTMLPSVYRDHPIRRSVSPEGSSKGRSTPNSPVSSSSAVIPLGSHLPLNHHHLQNHSNNSSANASNARHYLGVPAFMLNGQLAGRYNSMLAAQQSRFSDQTSSATTARASSPAGIAADASAADCRLIDYRGAKVAAFCINGEYLLCLPQAFDLFLKHLVGGLHTVYTKLKRLDITPIVCNVEQVRVLRGLGAIQPGVNRCKLLSCKDFDALYKDCTTASGNRLQAPNANQGLNRSSSPNQLMNGHAVKKSRDDLPTSNEVTNGHGDNAKVSMMSSQQQQAIAAAQHLQFLSQLHPQLQNQLHSQMPSGIHQQQAILNAVAMAANQGLSAARSTSSANNCNATTTKSGEQLQTEESPAPSRSSSEPPALNLSNQRAMSTHSESSDEVARESPMKDDPLDERNNSTASVELLLRNIQALLRVAAETARDFERKSVLEKTQLKMEIEKEREGRLSLERQLGEAIRLRDSRIRGPMWNGM